MYSKMQKQQNLLSSKFPAIRYMKHYRTYLEFYVGYCKKQPCGFMQFTFSKSNQICCSRSTSYQA